jgi:hypothetical protein
MSIRLLVRAIHLHVRLARGYFFEVKVSWEDIFHGGKLEVTHMIVEVFCQALLDDFMSLVSNKTLNILVLEKT